MDAVISATRKRKDQHIEICLQENVAAGRNWWDDIEIIGENIPEFDFHEIDTSIEVFNKKLKYPIVIAGMVGGTDRATTINRHLARLAE